MTTLLFSYRDHTRPHGGGAVHGFFVVEQLRRLGYRLLCAERNTDGRTERIPRTRGGGHIALEQADAIYMRCDPRPWDLAVLELNRRRYGRPVVVEYNAPPDEARAYGRGPLTALRVAGRERTYDAVVERAAALVCVSENLASYVQQRYAVARERIFVVPNGATPIAEAPPPHAGPFRAVWAGGARWPWQALDVIVEAAGRLAHAVPEARVHLFTDAAGQRFAGAPGVELHAAVSHRELAERLPSFDAALCLYRPIPGSAAGFYNSPLKLFDYLAAGLPVIGSRLGQIAHVLADGAGLLVDDNPTEVAEALIDLAGDPERRRSLGAAGLERLRARYTWDHCGDRLQAVLSSVIRPPLGY